MTDAQYLLQAVQDSETPQGPLIVQTLETSEPSSPVPGGAVPIDPAPAVATSTVPGAGVGNGVNALLWAGIGMGTMWLLGQGGGSVNGPKKNKWVAPVLIVGAAAAWFFFGDKIQALISPGASTTPAGGGTTTTTPTTTAADAQRQSLQQRYAGDTNALNAIASADNTTLSRWTTISNLWNQGASVSTIYSVGFDGVTHVTPYSTDSIGKWWENFSAQNHI